MKTKATKSRRKRTPVLVFELSDVSPTLLDGFDRRWDGTPLRFFLARRDQALFDGLAEAVPELDHPLAMEALELLEGPLMDECMHVMAKRLGIRPDGGMMRYASYAFVGDVDAASAWLEEHGADLQAFDELRSMHDPDRETLSMALERLGRSRTTASRIKSREAHLETSLARLPAVRRWAKKHLGLKLPRHLAVFHALTQSLSPTERRGLTDVGLWPYGLTRLFDVIEGGPRVEADHDPKLVARYRCDPPEMLTVATGDQDGEHFGLWYDDPGTFPVAVVCSFTRDTAATQLVGSTMLEVLAARVLAYLDLGEPTKQVLALGDAVAWFGDHDEAARKKDRINARDDATHIVGTPAPSFGLDDPRVGTHEARARAYRRAIATKRGRNKTVDRWIDEARADLDRVSATFAWILGHELHWLDADGYRADAASLLGSAYEALGHRAFAEILAAHVAHRDLEHVPALA